MSLWPDKRRVKFIALVSLDTKCSFGGFSHKSVQNAQKSIQNGMTDIFEPPLQDSA